MAGAIGKPPPRLRRGEILLASFRRRRRTIRGANGGGYTTPPQRAPFHPLHTLAYVDTRKADGASHQLFLYPVLPSSTQHVRGGSVSRRGLNQAARNRAQLSGGTNSAEATNSNASRSSGERGLGGEVLLSEKQPLPPALPFAYLFERGFGGERFSIEKCSPPKSFILFLDMRLGRVGRLGGRRRCRTS